MTKLLFLCLGALLLLAAPASRADQNDPRLPVLFDLLKESEAPFEAAQAEQNIWLIWLSSEDETIQELMQRGLTAMSENNLRDAYESFNSLVSAAPEFAEGWNKRATILYLLGDYKGSLSDIIKTLDLEPRHFGALSGRGLIYQALDDPKLAYEAYQEALAIHPYLPGALAFVKAYKEPGQPI
ncbi:tetratricopeptide repeat protein [Rhodovibrionaceae bacterium A322]